MIENPVNSNIIIYSSETKRFSNPVYNIAEDAKGFLWLDTRYGGLIRFDKETGVSKRYALSESPELGEISMHTIYEDAVYVQDVTNKIFYQYESETDRFISVLEVYTVVNFLEDENGWYWVGTWTQGLLHYNPNDGYIKPYTVKDGLPSNHAIQFLEDDKGLFWISTKTGMTKFNPKTKAFNRSGLPQDYFQAGAFKSKDGRFFLVVTKDYIRSIPIKQMESHFLLICPLYQS